jgi:hypothetical protein
MMAHAAAGQPLPFFPCNGKQTAGHKLSTIHQSGKFCLLQQRLGNHSLPGRPVHAATTVPG